VCERFVRLLPDLDVPKLLCDEDFPESRLAAGVRAVTAFFRADDY
jgi:hypothetical protein